MHAPTTHHPLTHTPPPHPFHYLLTTSPTHTPTKYPPPPQYPQSTPEQVKSYLTSQAASGQLWDVGDGGLQVRTTLRALPLVNMQGSKGQGMSTGAIVGLSVGVACAGMMVWGCGWGWVHAHTCSNDDPLCACTDTLFPWCGFTYVLGILQSCTYCASCTHTHTPIALTCTRTGLLMVACLTGVGVTIRKRVLAQQRRHSWDSALSSDKLRKYVWWKVWRRGWWCLGRGVVLGGVPVGIVLDWRVYFCVRV